MKAWLLIGALVLAAPADHDYERERCYYGDCGYEEEDGRQKRTCFFGCDNIIIVPGLPGMGGEEPRAS